MLPQRPVKLRPLAGGERREQLVLRGGAAVQRPRERAAAGGAERDDLTARLSFRLAAGGFALAQDYVEDRDGVVAVTGHGVFAVDLDDETVRWWWFDSFGYPPIEPSAGAWEGDQRLVVVKQTQRGTTRTTFALDGATLTQPIETRSPAEDDFALLVDGTYARVTRGPAAPSAVVLRC